MPERIQLRRTKGWRKPEGAIVVSRPSKWGNPFKVGEPVHADSPLWPYIAATVPGGAAGMTEVTPLRVEDVVAAYQDWLVEQPNLMLAIGDELTGRDLACWCPLPQPGEPDNCHAAVLLTIANETAEDFCVDCLSYECVCVVESVPAIQDVPTRGLL